MLASFRPTLCLSIVLLHLDDNLLQNQTIIFLFMSTDEHILKTTVGSRASGGQGEGGGEGTVCGRLVPKFD